MWKSLTLLTLTTIGLLFTSAATQADWFLWEVQLTHLEGDWTNKTVSVWQSPIKTKLSASWESRFGQRLLDLDLSTDQFCDTDVTVSFQLRPFDESVEQLTQQIFSGSGWLTFALWASTLLYFFYKLYRATDIVTLVLSLGIYFILIIVVLALLGPSTSSHPPCLLQALTETVTPGKYKVLATLRVDLLGFLPDGITYFLSGLGFQLAALFLAIFWGRIVRRISDLTGL